MPNDQKYELMSKGFLNAIKDYGDIQAEKAKITSEIMANEFKAKRNFFWKMQEKDYERKQQLGMIKNYIAEQQKRGQTAPTEVDMSKEVFGMSPGPELTLGSGGTPGVKNREANKTYWLQQLQKKKEYGLQTKGDPYAYFSEAEKRFEQQQLGGRQTGITQNHIVNLAIKLAQSESGGFASQEDIQAKMPIARQMLRVGESTTPQALPQNEYAPEQEQLIQDNMNAYKRPREEVIQALKARKLL